MSYRILNAQKDNVLSEANPTENRGRDELLDLKLAEGGRFDAVLAFPQSEGPFLGSNPDSTTHFRTQNPPSVQASPPMGELNPKKDDVLQLHGFPNARKKRPETAANFPSSSPDSVRAWLRIWNNAAGSLPDPPKFEISTLLNDFEEGFGVDAFPEKDVVSNWERPSESESWEEGDLKATGEITKSEPLDLFVRVDALLKESSRFRVRPANFIEGSFWQGFSSDSRTIFKPQLLLGFDDFVWQAPTDGEVPPFPIRIQSPNAPFSFQVGRSYEISLRIAREFKQRRFEGSTADSDVLLPPGSLTFSIQDRATNTTWFPFHPVCSRVSCRMTERGFPEYFFKLDLTNVPSNRVVDVHFNIEDGPSIFRAFSLQTSRHA